MTKTETRELMTAEIMACMAKKLKDLPIHIKIDLKGTTNFISFTEYGIYLCFYVTSSLSYSYRCDFWGGREQKVSLIEYDKDRDKKELKEMVKVAFDEALKKIGHAKSPAILPCD